jgi:hypothetical protein
MSTRTELDPHEGLVPLRSLPLRPAEARTRTAVKTHDLHELSGIFSAQATASGGGKAIRVCLVDTILQTGGAEWFATQLALMANPAVFEFVVVTFNSADSLLGERLKNAGISIFDATAWSQSGLTFAEWKEQTLFDQLDRLRPDVVFFSAQYLYEQLPHERLVEYPTVARISNFHAEKLGNADFSSAASVICTTEEQFAYSRARSAGLP